MKSVAQKILLLSLITAIVPFKGNAMEKRIDFEEINNDGSKCERLTKKTKHKDKNISSIRLYRHLKI